MGTAAVIIGLTGLTAIIIFRLVKNKKSSNGGCCNSCQNCPYSKNCH
ncbi:MAG: FeoB-associated Cys-rich membrane protein [Eubacterium sp.]